MALISVFKRIDRFGHRIDMHFDGRTSYQTVFGAFITVIVYTLILINTLNIGLDFINNGNQKEISRTSIENYADIGQKYITENQFEIIIGERRNPKPSLGKLKFF